MGFSVPKRQQNRTANRNICDESLGGHTQKRQCKKVSEDVLRQSARQITVLSVFRSGAQCVRRDRGRRACAQKQLKRGRILTKHGGARDIRTAQLTFLSRTRRARAPARAHEYKAVCTRNSLFRGCCLIAMFMRTFQFRRSLPRSWFFSSAGEMAAACERSCNLLLFSTEIYVFTGLKAALHKSLHHYLCEFKRATEGHISCFIVIQQA